MHHPIQFKRAIPLFLVTIVLACFGVLPQIQAVLPPPIPGNPDGCYPNLTTAEGCDALKFLGLGRGNTAVGWRSLYSVNDASLNTGLGAGTLVLTTRNGSASNDGDDNTATGAGAMLLNTSGHDNTANGTFALLYNASGNWNGAVGSFAMYSNIDGSFNNALGGHALFSNVHGSDNTALGDSALASNDAGGSGHASGNTAVGSRALMYNSDGAPYRGQQVRIKFLVHATRHGSPFGQDNPTDMFVDDVVLLCP